MRFIVLIFLLIPLLLFSQKGKIKGKITDDSGTPLIGVNIITNTSVGTVSDINGQYSFELEPGEYNIKFSYLGFNTTRRKVQIEDNETFDLSLILKEKTNQLQVYVVSASNYKKDIIQENISMDVLDAKMIESNNAIELGEAVDRSVGVQVQEGQILIRGGSSWSYGVGSRTAILVDGLNMTSADMGEAQMKYAPLEIMDRIEIVKGAASVIYGSSALNGIVNMITLWPGAEPVTKITSFHGLYGSVPRPELKWWASEEFPGFSGLSVLHMKKYQDWDFVLGGNYYYHKSYLQQGDEFRVRMNIKTRYRHPKKQGLMYGLNANVMLENSGRFFLSQDAYYNAYRRLDGGLDKYFRINLDPYWTFVKKQGDQHKIRMRYLNITRFPVGTQRLFNSNLFLLDYQFLKKFNDNWQLITGLPISFGIAKSNLYEGWRMNGSGAAYLQTEYKFNKLTLTGGCRYEFSAVDVIYSTSLPVFRTGLNYQFNEATAMRLSIGQAYRLPSIGERFIEAPFSSLNIYSNPDLVPEKGWGSEIGLKHRVDIGDFSAFLDGAFFFNEYKNLVEYTLGIYPPEGELPMIDYLGIKPINTEDARVAGFEFSVFGKGKIRELEISTLTGYSYNYPANLDMDTTQRNIGAYFANMLYGLSNRMEDYQDENGDWIDMQSKILNFRTRHIIKADIELKYRKWMIGYNMNYYSFPEKVPILYSLVLANLDKFREENGNSDCLHALRIGYEINEQLKISFIAKNITNEEYLTRVGRQDAPQNFTFKLVVKL